MKVLHYLLTLVTLLSVLSLSAQTSTRLKRVMVERFSVQQNNYLPEDSVEYYYAPGNPGYVADAEVRGIRNPFTRFDPIGYMQGMAYDSAMLYRRHLNPGSPAQKNIQTINTNKTINKATSYTSGPNNNWVTKETITNTYTNNSLTQQVYSTKNIKYIYGSGGTLDTITINYTGGGTTTTSYSYGNNKLTYTEYLYIDGSYVQHTKTSYIYSSGTNRPDIIVYTVENTGSQQWDTISVSEYTYNTNLDLIQEKFWEYNLYGQTGVKLAYQVDIQYDNANRRTEDIIWEDFYKHGPTRAGLVKHMRKQYSYNQYNKLATYNIDHWDELSTSWKPLVDTAMGYASKMKFEYEAYWPASIDQRQNTTDLQLYPSPASDFITINAVFNKPSNFTASICDMQGRILRQWNESPVQNYKRIVPLPEFPSGLYILKLSGNAINTSQQFSVTR